MAWSSFSSSKTFFKRKAADILFIIHFFFMGLPTLAAPDPEADPMLVEFRSRFISEMGASKMALLRTVDDFSLTGKKETAHLLKEAQTKEDLLKHLQVLVKERLLTNEKYQIILRDSKTYKEMIELYPCEIRGDILGFHSLSKEKSSKYKPGIPFTTPTLSVDTPKVGYLDRQGLYHGYRLLFGDGYIVPSMLVKFKNGHNTWNMEVRPLIKSLSSLQDLRDHYSSHGLGVQLLGSFFFSHQYFTPKSLSISGGKIVRLSSFRDRLETDDIFQDNPLFSEMKYLVLPDSLKAILKKQKVVSFIPQFLQALMKVEEAAISINHPETFQLKDSTISHCATRLQKIFELVSQPYDLTYGDISDLTFSDIGLSTTSSFRPLQEAVLLSLHNLFFSSEQDDWTEIFEFMGTIFQDYAPHFTKQAHHLKDPALVRESIQKNRTPSVLSFMLKGGLSSTNLGDAFHDVVINAGLRLDLSRAIDWIKSLAVAGAPLEHKDQNGFTALDLALQQNKPGLVESLINVGAGSDVKPHLIIDYLGSLGVGRNSFSKYIDLLEFRNHRLRWQLTLESLFPLTTHRDGLVVKTTDGERTLSSERIAQLFEDGKVKAKHFLSFTKTVDKDQKKYGRHTVGKITDGRYSLYVKQHPELPGIEEAVGTLTRQILGYGAPNTLLANINGTAYLFSEGVSGRPLHDYLTGQTETPWSQVYLHPESLSGMMLLAMLTNPEDGKPDNYILQPRPDGYYQIIGIDNDHAFVPSATTVQGKRKINVKSILFAFHQMNQELHPTLKRKFLYHKPRDVMEEWIKTLMIRSTQYESLFTQKEIVDHFSDHKSFLGIALHPSIVVELYKNLVALQHLVESEETLTHMDILRRFHKSIYLRYQEGHTHFPEEGPLARFKYVDGKEYKLSKEKAFKTLSTGKHLLSTNMMITTKKDLIDYVKRKRGREIRLDTSLQTLQEIADQDTHMLVQQAMNQTDVGISLEQMTDPQRENFLKELDWSKLPIANQQALLDQMAQVSWGDPTQNVGPWRGSLIFKNCSAFTTSNFLRKGFDQKMNWENIHEVRLIVDATGGKEAYIRAAKALQKTTVPLKVELHGLELTDEDLDLITSQGHVEKLILVGCHGPIDSELRQKFPNLVWGDWMLLKEETRNHVKKAIGEGLKDLNLSKSGIGIEGARALSAVLKGSQVQTLKLENNAIRDSGITALVAILKGSEIQTLNLTSNSIGSVGAVALAEGLKDSKLQNLIFRGNPVGASGTSILAFALKDSKIKSLELGFDLSPPAALAQNQMNFASWLQYRLKDSQIEELTLYGNMGDVGVKALAIGLRGSKVQKLVLGSNSKMGVNGLKDLVESLKESKVQHLDLNGNKIGDEGAKLLASALKDSQIDCLRLQQTNIGDEGAKVLASVLRDSPIRVLVLFKNKVGIEGMKALGEVLKDSKITGLNLGKNNIGDEGAKVLAAALKDSQLRSLYLEKSNIKIEGTKAIAAALKDSKITGLDLGKNNIGDEGAKILAGALKDSKVTGLNLGKNNIGDEGAKALSVAIKGSKLQTLDTEKNSIADEILKSIEANLKENKERYGQGPSKKALKEVAAEEDEDEPSSPQKLVSKVHKPHETSEVSLASLLEEAGAKGGGKQLTFPNDIEKAKYLLEQNDPNTYPSLLTILVYALKTSKHSSASALGEISLDTEKSDKGSDSSFQDPLLLLQKLSASYPRAFLPLAEEYHMRGNIDAVVEVLTKALYHQIPGTLEQIQSFYKEENLWSYDLLMAENYLVGVMSPPDLDQGEMWLRRALTKYRDNPDILTRLAQVLVDKGGLEEDKSYVEIQHLLAQAKTQHHTAALSLSLMIEELQNNRKVKESPIAEKDQRYNERQQRLLQALYQSQFLKLTLDIQDLAQDLMETQKQQVKDVGLHYEKERQEVILEIERAQADLLKSNPLGRPALEEAIPQLRQKLKKVDGMQHQAIKRIFFPEGVRASPTLKIFYEDLSVFLRQQFSLLDAIEGGLAERKSAFLEKNLKDAVVSAVGYVGNMVISNIPVPANGILALLVSKATEMAINKVTEVMQDRITSQYNAKADKERQGVRAVTKDYENVEVIAKGISALYTYRLQNILPYLTEKSARDLAARLAKSVLDYLQDKRRITSPQNITQLVVMGFYQTKGMTVAEAIARAKRTYGFVKTDGTLMSYAEIFGRPLIETTDGARYQLIKADSSLPSFSSGIQFVPLIERDILQNKLLNARQTLEEKRIPQMPPFQVDILRDQDDIDYARRAVDFVVSLY